MTRRDFLLACSAAVAASLAAFRLVRRQPAQQEVGMVFKPIKHTWRKMGGTWVREIEEMELLSMGLH